ncbi:hypothetical protein L596_017183 [Steinernema carpocapsae]|uniref:Uncharacterized protein n=1 Tax=Steinernema carpocapsae TaxID=34508 RepID=A0A4U5N0V3_STECR|nr:hypothetical protein L596_017183 [Steinernema carpocapsae]
MAQWWKILSSSSKDTGTQRSYFSSFFDRTDWSREVFKVADHDSGVSIVRNGFSSAQNGKVWIKQKKILQVVGGSDAITLHKPQLATMKTE